MENRTNNSSQQRHKKKNKLRYDRIAILVIIAIVIVFVVVYSIGKLLSKGNDTDGKNSSSSNTSSSSLPVVKPISSGGANSYNSKENVSNSDMVVDAIASSSVKPITGKQLDTIIEKRVLAAEYTITSKAAEKPVTKPIATPPSVNPSTNLPADAGSASNSSSSSSAVSGSAPVSSSSTANSSSIPISPVTSSSVPAVSSSEAPTAPPAKFDPATIGSSGATNIKKWKDVNSDVRAWIKVPNTNINFPVVIGADNNYYSEKGYYKEANKNGVIWADSHVKFGDKTKISKNTVLYGHNWTNYLSNPRIGDPKDEMFGQLPAYDHLSFAQQTPYIYYSTEDETMLYKVFAVFYTETAFNYIATDAEPSGQLYIIEEAKRRSKFNFDVDVKSNDKILTLSTCTRVYGPSSDQRFVVMARLMRPEEEIKAVTITDNPNHKKPTL